MEAIVEGPASTAIVAVRPAAFLEGDDLATLRDAYRRLERESFAARLSSAVGRQVDLASGLIPARVRDVAARAAEAALKTAMRLALRSLKPSQRPASLAFHRTLAAASGAAGGAFGLAALPLELPVSTTVILRAIADVARAEGEDVGDPETALACMEVFALGARNEPEDGFESGYFAVRGLLAKSLSQVGRHVLHKRLVDETTPALMRFLSQIAARFGMAVSQKIAAQAVPIIGAVGGAVVNYAFVDHFQSLARGHFAVRRLERLYGQTIVRAEYERIRADESARSASLVGQPPIKALSSP